MIGAALAIVGCVLAMIGEAKRAHEERPKTLFEALRKRGLL